MKYNPLCQISLVYIPMWFVLAFEKIFLAAEYPDYRILRFATDNTDYRMHGH